MILMNLIIIPSHPSVMIRPLTKMAGILRHSIIFRGLLLVLCSILVDHDLKVWALPKASRPKKNKYRKTELAKKRKANRAELTNYHMNYVPRIVKSDVRRQYGFMFASVYNHCDYDYMMKFIQTFVRPRSTVSSRRTGEIFAVSLLLSNHYIFLS